MQPSANPTAIHIATYHPGPPTHYRVMTLPALLMLAGFAIVVLAVSVGELLVLATVGGFFIARMGVLLWRYTANWGVDTELRSDGLHRQSGMQQRGIAFDQIQAINTTGGTLSVYPVEFVHVFTADDEHLIFAGRVGFEFGRLLRLEHAAHVTPGLLEQIKRGEPVEFRGRGVTVFVTAEGVQQGTARIPWRNVEGVRLHERTIELCAGGEWRTLTPLNRLQNAHVFYDLVQRANGHFSSTPPSPDHA